MYWEKADAFSEIVFRLGATPTPWALLSEKRLRGADNSDDDLEQLRPWGNSLGAPMKAVVDEYILYQTGWADDRVPLGKVFDPSRGTFDPALSKIFQEIRQDLEEEEGDGHKSVRLMLPQLQELMWM